MTLGLYVPGDSPLHRAPAAAKLLALVVLGVGAFQLASSAWMASGLALVVLLGALAGVPPRTLLAHARPALVMLAVIFVAHALLTTWPQGLLVVLRFGLLILSATLVTLTTRVADMVGVVERACGPLRRVGVSPARVGLVLALAIRFVPVLAEKLREIREARWARGVDRPTVMVLVPLLIKTLRFADQTAEAIDARGFEG